MSNPLAPRRKSTDYDKQKISEAEILQIGIENETKISNARKKFAKGETMQLTATQEMSPDELLQDIGQQESAARANLLRIGFRDQEALEILGSLIAEPDVLRAFNISYPSIEADIMKRFNTKLITPAFFLNYLREYVETLNASRGLDINSSSAVKRSINGLINNIDEVRRIIPSPDVINAIIMASEQQSLVGPETISKLQNIRLWTMSITQLGKNSPVDNYTNTQRVLDALQNLPNLRDITDLATDLRRNIGRQERMNIISRINDLASAAPNKLPPQELAPVGKTWRDIERQQSSQENIPITITPAVKELRRNELLSAAETRRAANAPMKTVSESLIGQAKPTLSLAQARMKIAEQPQFLEPVLEFVIEPETPRVSTGKIFKPILTFEDLNDSPSIEAIKELAQAIIDDGITILNNITSKPITNVNNLSVSQKSKVKVYWRNTNLRAVAKTYLSPERGKMASFLKSGQQTPRGTMSLKSADIQAPIIGLGVNQIKKLKSIKLGKGISVVEQPTFKLFGKYAIHMNHLINNDLLNVKYKSMATLPKYNKPIPVSDVLRDFIVDLLDTGKVNQRNYMQISPEERKLFEDLAINAGVWSGLNLKRTTTNNDEEQHKRFELLRSELIAGNNSSKLLQELRQLVVTFINTGKIRKAQGYQLLMELSAR